jgi:protein O-mannosyl-transferase
MSEKEPPQEEFSFKNYFVPFTTTKAIAWIIIIGLIVYANMLFNGFVEDDKTYIINNTLVHTLNFSSAFGTNLFNKAGQYRPIAVIYFSILYSLFNTTPFFYHLLQLLMQIACSILAFTLFRKRISSGIAFFLSLIFLVHPMQVESVSYIAQSINPLSSFFGICSFFLLTSDKITVKKFGSSILLLLIALFIKETSIVFYLMAIIYRFLFLKNGYRTLFVSGFITLIIYFITRIFIGHICSSYISRSYSYLQWDSQKWRWRCCCWHERSVI